MQLRWLVYTLRIQLRKKVPSADKDVPMGSTWISMGWMIIHLLAVIQLQMPIHGSLPKLAQSWWRAWLKLLFSDKEIASFCAQWVKTEPESESDRLPQIQEETIILKRVCHRFLLKNKLLSSSSKDNKQTSLSSCVSNAGKKTKWMVVKAPKYCPTSWMLDD